jgi:hypothetical protein
MTEPANELEAQVAAMELEDYRLNHLLATANAAVTQLKHEVTCWEYGAHRLNQLLATRNSATGRGMVWTEGKDILVCACRKCEGGRRFGTASAAGIWRAFSTGVHDGECVIKKCLKHLCERHGLICTECDRNGWHVAHLSCHIALVDFGDTWRAEYGSMLGGSGVFHEHPMFPRVQAVFEEISGPHTLGENTGWNAVTDAAVCSLFGFPPTEFHGFFTDAEGTDHYALALMREKARLGGGDYLAGGEEKGGQEA